MPALGFGTLIPEDSVISAIAAGVGKTPAQVLLAWAIQRGTALLTTPRNAARARESFNISALPNDAFDEINRIQTRQRLNTVVKTGIPGSFHKVAEGGRAKDTLSGRSPKSSPGLNGTKSRNVRSLFLPRRGMRTQPRGLPWQRWFNVASPEGAPGFPDVVSWGVS
jgi:hypothetical protein